MTRSSSLPCGPRLSTAHAQWSVEESRAFDCIFKRFVASQFYLFLDKLVEDGKICASEMRILIHYEQKASM